MNTVEPIRDMAKIEEMKKVLLENSLRDYMLFVVGINVGLRISDILKLKAKDFNMEYITIKEKKTKKVNRFAISDKLREEVKKYIEGFNSEDYLFQSRKGDNKPITPVQAYRILNTAADKIGLESIGTHTMRKTFGYWHYKQYKDVAVLQDIFNHSAPSITMRYIGITQDIKDDTRRGFYL